jgi:iron complex transport system substrate-binding protein
MTALHYMRRATTALLLAATLAFALACGSDDDDPPRTVVEDPTEIAGLTPVSSFPVTVQRSDGKELRVEAPVSKIASLSPGATEVIFALGAESRLVAVDQQADYPDGAQNFARKLDAYQPNVEAIAALQPDLVIVADDSNGIVGALDRINVPVLYIDLDTDVRTMNDVFGQIGLIGRLTGTEEKANQMVVELNARVDAVVEKLEGLATTDGPVVYHELDSTFYSVAEQTFIGSLYRTLKARNIARDGGGVSYPQLSQEAIIEANPDVIVLADEEFGVTIESVKARPGWGAIKAVQEDRIYGIDPDIISRPGPRIVDALEQLAARFYPNTFGAAGSPTAEPTPAQ